MDQDSLRELVITQKPAEFLQTLAPLSEKERKGLSVFSYKLYQEIDRGELKKDTHSSLKELFKKINNSDWNVRRHAHYYPNSVLAVIALSSLTNAKKVHLWQISHEKEHLLDRVIRDRNPEWLTEWVNAKLDEEFIGISWQLLRVWIRDGLCKKPRARVISGCSAMIFRVGTDVRRMQYR